MLAYVPVVFELYRPLRPHLRWTLQCLVSFADRDGRCWPSVRTLAVHAGISKSAAARHLAQLVCTGIITRRRKPGGVYIYTIDRRFLPAQRSVSRPRAHAVPPAPGKEYPPKKISDSAMPDDRAQWQARLRSWRQSGFWLPQFGPRPDETGCLAPISILRAPLPA